MAKKVPPPLTYQSTKELSGKVCVRPQTILSHHAKTGHYYGIVPCKLASGRLLWPGDAEFILTNRLNAGGKK